MDSKALILACLCTASSLAALDTQRPVYEVTAVSGWDRLGREDSLPYQAETMAAQWFFGARSSSGSYVLITKIDNTLGRPALAAEELMGFFSKDNYVDLEPEDFLSELVEIEVSGIGKAQGVRSSFSTAHLGYDVGQGSDLAAVRSVFLPLTLWNRGQNLYVNWIYVADFRGAAAATGDLEAFDRLWRSVSLPEGWTLIDLAGFNALRPNLLARSEIVEPLPAPDGETPEPHVEVEALAGAMLRTLAGDGSDQDARLLQDVRSSHRETVVAGVLDRITAASTGTWQQEVWERTFARAPDEQRPRIAALFLAESIAHGEGDLAEEIARDALERLGNLSVIPCPELELLLDGLLRAPPVASWSSEPVRRFFRLGSKTACGDLDEILRRRGFEIPKEGRDLLQTLR